jgi:carbamoylphosphate synthase large subunit
MIFPIDWKAAFEYVGFPAFFKPHSGGGWKNVYKVHNEGDFFHYYHQTGDLVMTLQENIEFEEYFRCYCIGQEKVHIMRYDPKQPHENRYVKNAPPIEPQLYDCMVNDCLTICRALGYDIDTIEFAVRDGIPYAIDFLNPAPDADYHSVGPENFTWIVNTVAEFAVKKVLKEENPTAEYRWAEFLNGQTIPDSSLKRSVNTSRK